MAEAFQSLLQAALAATRSGQLIEAEDMLRKAGALDPKSPLPYLLLASQLAPKGASDQAEAAFVTCLSRDPSLSIARFQLGLLQLVNGRAAVAQATWEMLLESENNDPLKHFALAFISILQGDRSAAEASIQCGIALNIDNPSLNDDMRGVLARLASHGKIDGMAAVDESAPEQKAEENSEHFLISNYRHN